MTVASNIGSPDHDVLSLAATNLDASPRVHGRVAPAAQLRTVARLEAVGTASDTLAQQSSLGEWGEKLGLSEPVQRDMFQRAMSKIFGSQAPPAPASNLRIGRHTILQTLGEGGMGVVYAAYDPELDRKVAIKLVNGDGAGVEGKARLLREAQAMAKLAHPNVAAIYDVGLCGEQVYVAMEFIKGETLKAWSERHRGDWRRLVAMFVDAGEGLEATWSSAPSTSSPRSPPSTPATTRRACAPRSPRPRIQRPPRPSKGSARSSGAPRSSSEQASSRRAWSSRGGSVSTPRSSTTRRSSPAPS
jgi:hypothetical protein